MKTKLFLLTTSTAILSSLFSIQAQAKSGFIALQPAAYNGVISCTSCHASSAANGGNVTQPYGVLFKSKVGYNNVSTAGYISLEGYDSDGDGFTNGQEIYGFSDFNTPISKPILGFGSLSSGSASAKVLVNETISSITQTLTTPASVHALLVSGERNIGGTVDLTLANPTLNSVTPTLLFNTGGLATSAKAYFIDTNNNASLITGTTVNKNGSITIPLTDEGAYDTYSQANYIALTKSRTPIIDATAVISPYATISPYAVVSPGATINDYATVGAYALIGANAIVDTYAVVDDYTEVLAGATVAANTTVSMPTTFTGIIQTKIAVATVSPVGAGSGTAGGGTDTQTGQLHCMSSGLGLQGLIFLSLFGAGYLLRRKKK